jgi:hypothetical protein
MMYGGWAWRFYPWGYAPFPYGYWNGYNRTYTEGTLIIDAIDAETNQLIWRGSISGAIDNPENLHKKVMKAVEIIFRKFPIKPGSAPLRQNESPPTASKKRETSSHFGMPLSFKCRNIQNTKWLFHNASMAQSSQIKRNLEEEYFKS